jgi:hypothetical protein
MLEMRISTTTVLLAVWLACGAVFAQQRGCLTGTNGKVICLGESKDLPEAERLEAARKRNMRQQEWAKEQSDARAAENLRRMEIELARERARAQAAVEASARAAERALNEARYRTPAAPPTYFCPPRSPWCYPH